MGSRVFLWLLGIVSIAMVGYALFKLVLFWGLLQLLSGFNGSASPPPRTAPAPTATAPGTGTAANSPPTPPPQHPAFGPEFNVLEVPQSYTGLVLVHYGNPKASVPRRQANHIAVGGNGLAWTPHPRSSVQVSVISVLGGAVLKPEPLLVHEVTKDEVIEVYAIELAGEPADLKARAERTLARYLAEGCPVNFVQPSR